AAPHGPRVDHRHVVHCPVGQIRYGSLAAIPVRDRLRPVLDLLPLYRVGVSASPGRHEFLANDARDPGPRYFAQYTAPTPGRRVRKEAVAEAGERGDVGLLQERRSDEGITAVASL